jgi:hypothetical protein
MKVPASKTKKITINTVIKLLVVLEVLAESGGHAGMNMDDIFSQFGIFGSAFGGGGGWRRGQQN